VLSFTTNDIEHMKRDYPYTTAKFFRKMMQQTKTLMIDHQQTLLNKDRRFIIKRFTTDVVPGGKSIADENMVKVFKMYRVK